MTASVGFVVIYRWRIHPDKERQFQEIWALNTRKIAEYCGGLGSRLHKADDGTWLAYAQWPDKETWEQSASIAWGPERPEEMEAAIIERLPPTLLHPIADLLAKREIGA